MPVRNKGLIFNENAVRLISRIIPGDVLWYVATDAPVFALTFDDGPSPVTTPGLLDVLARHRARATFFLIGERARENPELVRAIVGGGHEIANHMMREERSAFEPAAKFREGLAGTTALLTPHQQPIRFFRPGGGVFTPWMLREAGRQGLRCVLGTMVDRTEGVRPGSIVVLHEGGPSRRGVIGAADEMLGRLPLRAVTVSELLP